MWNRVALSTCHLISYGLKGIARLNSRIDSITIPFLTASRPKEQVLQQPRNLTDLTALSVWCFVGSKAKCFGSDAAQSSQNPAGVHHSRFRGAAGVAGCAKQSQPAC